MALLDTLLMGLVVVAYIADGATEAGSKTLVMRPSVRVKVAMDKATEGGETKEHPEQIWNITVKSYRQVPGQHLKKHLNQGDISHPVLEPIENAAYKHFLGIDRVETGSRVYPNQTANQPDVSNRDEKDKDVDTKTVPRYSEKVDSAVRMRSINQSVKADASLDKGKEQSVTADASLDTGKEQSVTADTSLDKGKEQGVTADTSLDKGKEQGVTADTSLDTGKEQGVTADTSLDTGKEQSVTADTLLDMGKEQSVTADTPLDTETQQGVTADTPLDMGKEQGVTADTSLDTGKEQGVTTVISFDTGKEQGVTTLTSLDTGKEQGVTAYTSLDTGKEHHSKAEKSQQVANLSNRMTRVINDEKLPIQQDGRRESVPSANHMSPANIDKNKSPSKVSHSNDLSDRSTNYAELVNRTTAFVPRTIKSANDDHPSIEMNQTQLLSAALGVKYQYKATVKFRDIAQDKKSKINGKLTIQSNSIRPQMKPVAIGKIQKTYQVQGTDENVKTIHQVPSRIDKVLTNQQNSRINDEVTTKHHKRNFFDKHYRIPTTFKVKNDLNAQRYVSIENKNRYIPPLVRKVKAITRVPSATNHQVSRSFEQRGSNNKNTYHGVNAVTKDWTKCHQKGSFAAPGTNSQIPSLFDKISKHRHVSSAVDKKGNKNKNQSQIGFGQSGNDHNIASTVDTFISSKRSSTVDKIMTNQHLQNFVKNEISYHHVKGTDSTRLKNHISATDHARTNQHVPRIAGEQTTNNHQSKKALKIDLAGNVKTHNNTVERVASRHRIQSTADSQRANHHLPNTENKGKINPNRRSTAEEVRTNYYVDKVRTNSAIPSTNHDVQSTADKVTTHKNVPSDAGGGQKSHHVPSTVENRTLIHHILRAFENIKKSHTKEPSMVDKERTSQRVTSTTDKHIVVFLSPDENTFDEMRVDQNIQTVPHQVNKITTKHQLTKSGDRIWTNDHIPSTRYDQHHVHSSSPTDFGQQTRTFIKAPRTFHKVRSDHSLQTVPSLVDKLRRNHQTQSRADKNVLSVFDKLRRHNHVSNLVNKARINNQVSSTPDSHLVVVLSPDEALDSGLSTKSDSRFLQSLSKLVGARLAATTNPHTSYTVPSAGRPTGYVNKGRVFPYQHRHWASRRGSVATELNAPPARETLVKQNSRTGTSHRNQTSRTKHKVGNQHGEHRSSRKGHKSQNEDLRTNRQEHGHKTSDSSEDVSSGEINDQI